MPDLRAVDVPAETVVVVVVAAVAEVLLPTDSAVQRSQLSSPQSPALRGPRHGHPLRRERQPRQRSRVRNSLQLQQPQNP